MIKCKSALVIAMILLLASSLSCSKLFTYQESNDHFTGYEKKLCKIVADFGFSLENEASADYPVLEKHISRNYIVSLNDGDTVRINLDNYLQHENKGSETFSVEYTISRIENQFNVELFTALVNAVSGKKITTELCTEFIDAPEERYPVSRYNRKKGKDEVAAKCNALNFFEDWMIYHSEYLDGREVLSLYGLIG